ncbi:MAG: aspartate aminotransferase family protein [Candidatus Eisenbacteria bacterium]|nr:aspartate aminotransferase family protein [Candidatus Eisenbacteria bacterium]
MSVQITGKKLSKEDVISKHKEFLFPCVANYYKEPLVLERGEGAYLFDVTGKRYLDFFGGILTVSVGHSNAKVTGKIKAQLDKLQHTSTLYPNEAIVSLAERLSRITPGKLKKSFFTSSGTEADETAVLLARIHTGFQEVIALRHAYSGRSMLAMTLTGHASWKQGGTHILGIKHAHSPYCYRCSLGLTYPSCDLRCAKDIEELIQTSTSGKIAGFIAEPIQGVGGFITPPKEYFKEAVSIIRKYGGVFICDEVQTGFGRTGGRMFGIEHWDVEPEIMTCAKGIANGAPMGVTIATDEVASSFKGLSISTFGGNPVSCVASLATIDVIEEENLKENAKTVGAHLRDGLEELKQKHKSVGDVRGMGLMQAVELVKEKREPAPDILAGVFEKTREKGLLIGKGGLFGNVIRISPPLNISKKDVDEAVRILDFALS